MCQSIDTMHFNAIQCSTWVGVERTIIRESRGRIATCGELQSLRLGGQQLNCRRLRFRKAINCISLVEIQRMLARVVKVHQVLATLSTFDQNRKATGFRATCNDTQCPNADTQHLCGSGAPGWGPRVPQAQRLAARFWQRPY